MDNDDDTKTRRSETGSFDSSRRRLPLVIDMPTLNGRPITLVTPPETRGEPATQVDRDAISFRNDVATFYDEWRREMDGAEMGPRVRFARATSEQDAPPREAVLAEETVAHDDAELVTELNPALDAIDPPHVDPPLAAARPKRALSPTVEVDAELFDELDELDSELLDDIEPHLVDEPAPNDEYTAEHRAAFEPSHLNWLGVATSQPQVGARLVIGAGSSGEFMLTAAVSLILPHHDGVFVQTSTNNRYFVAQSGDTFLVQLLRRT